MPLHIRSLRCCRDDYVEVMRALKPSVDAAVAAFLEHVPLLACCTAAELLALAQVRALHDGGRGMRRGSMGEKGGGCVCGSEARGIGVRVGL